MNESLIQLLLPIIGGFLSAGGIGAYYLYKGNKIKVSAEAKKINADVVVTFADGWQKYAEKLEHRMDELEKLIEDKDRAHAKVVLDKDKRIDELEARVYELEKELDKYKNMENRVESAKVGLHEDVDKKLDDIKKPNEEA